MHHEVKLVEFPEQPDVLDRGFRQKYLHSPYRCSWEQNGRQVRLTAPAGMLYNGASVPQIVWSLYPPHVLDRAAVFHDLIYHRGGVMRPGEHEYLDESGLWVDVPGVWTRNAADTFFFKQLNVDPNGPGWFKRQAAYRVVRIFGSGSWAPADRFDPALDRRPI